MAILDANKLVEEFVNQVFTEARTYYGERLSEKLRRLIRFEGNEKKAAAYVPVWWSVLQRGRGKARNNPNQHDTIDGVKVTLFAKAIYFWMQKRNMFKSVTAKGKVNEAKGLAYYINQKGTQQYRKGVYIDVYDTILKEFRQNVLNKYSSQIKSINSDFLIPKL